MDVIDLITVLGFAVGLLSLGICIGIYIKK